MPTGLLHPSALGGPDLLSLATLVSASQVTPRKPAPPFRGDKLPPCSQVGRPKRGLCWVPERKLRRRL